MTEQDVATHLLYYSGTSIFATKAIFFEKKKEEEMLIAYMEILHPKSLIYYCQIFTAALNGFKGAAADKK